MIVSGIPGKGCAFEVRELSGGTSRIVFDYRTMAKRKECRASHGHTAYVADGLTFGTKGETIIFVGWNPSFCPEN